ncbi:Glycosyl transferase family 2 [Formivibrio citricus]|uniref:Glycosyl transferase family 2 n=1 Tax=Formivibrio citricus TaxID=83765 RepID=A0A1I4XWT0_9NEIS|nr:glycosyltransferase family A protein [Formivibrio citricus]SFN30371.1 Glycosyl transferase family 2 [Formivibrio citricus]
MQQANPPLVSVVIPTRNRCERLSQAIASAKAQTWPNIEIIVIDEASDDATPAYLASLAAEDPRVHLIRNDHPRGGGGARNQGIDAASGVYIAFLDDDDIWLPEKLAAQMTLLQAQPGASAVSCGFVVEYPFSILRGVRVVPPSDAQQLLRANHLGGASMCLATKSALAAIHGFDPSLRSGQDWDLWLKLYDQGPILVCDQPLVRYVPHRGVRITGNPGSAYSGRRRIFFRYRSRMTAMTQRFLLSELVYCRKVLMGKTARRIAKGFLHVLHLACGTNAVRYVYRYLKHLSRV